MMYNAVAFLIGLLILGPGFTLYIKKSRMENLEKFTVLSTRTVQALWLVL